MRVSIDWLKQYLKFDESPEEICDILTSLGLEAEGMEKMESVKGGLEGVVVGQVLQVWPHPNADRLKLTRVDIGATEILQIVCGAANVAEGQKVLVAKEGSTIHPISGEPLTIKKGKIRGEFSEGMICAEDELGLGKSHEGIMVLEDDAPVGQAAALFLKLESDQIIEIGLTPNRADATHHLGVARDILAWLRVHRTPNASLVLPPLAPIHQISQGSKEFKIEVEDFEKCPRYSGVIINNIKVAPSPKWLQQRITSMGHKPVNNIVDITNFILFEMGQPLHAFDLKHLAKGVRIKQAEKDAKFVTLDGMERKLDSEDLMICNLEGKSLCMAGVLGGLDSGVNEDTVSIFLESAHFNPSSIRKTSTRHLIFSQAAKIFEKGSDPNLCLTALQRAVYLIQDIAGGKIEGDYFDRYPNPVLPVKIHLSLEEISSLTGIALDESTLKQIFLALEMDFTDHRDGNFTVEIPSSKPDVKRPADLIEEICRVYGLDHIPVLPKIQISFPKKIKSSYSLRKKMADWLTANGFHETMTISHASSALALKSEVWKDDELVYIHNTSNTSLNIMKPSVLLCGLENIAFNQNRQQADLAIFEFAREYRINEGKIHESSKLGIWWTGQMQAAHWLKPKPEGYHFYDLKSTVEGLLYHFGVLHQVKPEDPGMMEGGIWEYGQKWGKVAIGGLVSTRFTKMYDIKKSVWFAQFNLDRLEQLFQKSPIPFKEISKFPSSSRDLAVVIPEELSYQKIKDLAIRKLGKTLISIELFDVYRNSELLGAGKKSYALHFEFSSSEGPLSAKYLDQLMQNCIEEMESEFGALVRK
ncbi:MAG: phenylalanine--tRNA ligase subunit beta [Saprospiraceae bacterium]|nr:phenylalanine--tRNA ligase subunit beta [Saprospiraceae bacterium]